MGSKIPNLIEKIDHATGKRSCSIELHMDLPLKPGQLKLVSTLLRENDWSGARDAVADAYPQYAELLNLWFAESEARQRREATEPREAARVS